MLRLCAAAAGRVDADRARVDVELDELAEEDARLGEHVLEVGAVEVEVERAAVLELVDLVVREGVGVGVRRWATSTTRLPVPPGVALTRMRNASEVARHFVPIADSGCGIRPCPNFIGISRLVHDGLQLER